MTLLPLSFKFIGKNAIAKVPIFGPIYEKVHITVDRNRISSKIAAQRKAIKEIENGNSLGFFPEGGMKSLKPPNMVRFKDGAFQLADSMEVPILPVTLKTNYKLMPKDKWLSVYRGPFEMVVHEPQSSDKKTLNPVKDLRDRVYQIIQDELNDKII